MQQRNSDKMVQSKIDQLSHAPAGSEVNFANTWKSLEQKLEQPKRKPVFNWPVAAMFILLAAFAIVFLTTKKTTQHASIAHANKIENTSVLKEQQRTLHTIGKKDENGNSEIKQAPKRYTVNHNKQQVKHVIPLLAIDTMNYLQAEVSMPATVLNENAPVLVTTQKAKLKVVHLNELSQQEPATNVRTQLTISKDEKQPVRITPGSFPLWSNTSKQPAETVREN
jgi:hypothetical protein